MSTFDKGTLSGSFQMDHPLLPYTFPLTDDGLLIVLYFHPGVSLNSLGSSQRLSCLIVQERAHDIQPNIFLLLPKATDYPWLSALIMNFLKVFEFISTCQVQDILPGTPLKIANERKSVPMNRVKSSETFL